MGVDALVDELEGSPRPCLSSCYGKTQSREIVKSGNVTALTVSEMWDQSCKKHVSRQCLGAQMSHEKFTFMSYKEINYHVKCLCSPLLQFSKGQKSHAVCIWGSKCPAWMVLFLGCARAGLMSVPIDSKTPTYTTNMILEDSQPFLIFVSRDDLLKVAKTLGRYPNMVDYVVYWGDECPHYADEMEELQKANVSIYYLGEVLEMGELFRDAVRSAAKPHTELAMMYTVGDEGKVTGVRFTHSDILWGISCYKSHYEAKGKGITCQDSALSSLSMLQMCDWTLELLLLHCGGSIGYCKDSSSPLLEAAQCLKPTMILSAPAALADVCKGLPIYTPNSSFLRRVAERFLFRWGCRRKLAFLRSGLDFSDASPVFDALFSHRLSNLLGGRQRLILSCGSGLSSDHVELLEVAMSCPLDQLCSTAHLAATPFFSLPGPTVGDPYVRVSLPLVRWCLRSPQTKMTPGSAINHGELLVSMEKHSNEKTHEDHNTSSSNDSQMQDKWIPTGEIAEIQVGGALKIVQPHLQQGILMHCQGSFNFIQNVYRKARSVAEVVVCCSEEDEKLVASVIPDCTAFTKWSNRHRFNSMDTATIFDPEFVSATLDDLNSTGREFGLQDHEMLDRITMVHPPHRQMSKHLSWNRSSKRALLHSASDNTNMSFEWRQMFGGHHGINLGEHTRFLSA